MSLHKYLEPIDNHTPFAYVYANATARLAADGFVAEDLYKTAFQIDTSAQWVLTSIDPIVWSVSVAASSGSVDSVNGLDGIVVLDHTHVGAEKANADIMLHLSSSSNPHSTTKSHVGLGSVENYGIASQAQAESGSANNVYMTPLRVKEAIDTFATGSGAVDSVNGMSGSVVIGAGDVGAEPANADILLHLSSSDNPHSVSAAQVGAEPANADILLHLSSSSNPHSVSASDIGLGNVDNTSDLDAGISTATQAALDLKASDSDLSAHTVDTSIHFGTGSIDHLTIQNIGTNSHAVIDSHIASNANPHSTTKSHVGLGSVENYGIASQAQAESGSANNVYMTPLRTKEAIDQFAGSAGEANTASNLGAGSVVFAEKSGVDLRFKSLVAGTNTTLSSSASEITINSDGEANLVESVNGFSGSVVLDYSDVGAEQANADILLHLSSSSNPHSVSAAQVGAEPANADILLHLSSSSNPHSTTATHVGLGNCDNTADLSKPISTAQQTALDLKADTSALTSHTGDTSIHFGTGSIDHTTILNIGTNSHAQIDSHIASSANPHSTTATHVGLGNCDNTSDANKPVSTAQQTALDGKLNNIPTFTQATITTVIDFDAASHHTINLSGNTTFTTSNRAIGKRADIRIVGDGTERTLTFPAWKWIEGALATVPINKTAVVSLISWGTTDADITATYGLEE